MENALEHSFTELLDFLLLMQGVLEGNCGTNSSCSCYACSWVQHTTTPQRHPKRCI